ncbi:zinc finger and BTB domain-containing protein 49-like [Cyprinodon tularosa]|uniref:zinc finger and BTB domain-containing protein 49-like n=1 Tax=Cyprinodon tularosa TaxID=77115 RepID=UPI0018E2188F|nr:zinc finger and BTB domain-containing protein 49-like [Cyprinodon tularosa]XP_038158214.1 zinc finger and BTB domain-containing protein 49-like [Cyprinodon tularosa]
MSVLIHTRGEAGGGVAAHLRCSHCGHLSKSHAQQLSHLAASHPACLDDVAVGRLGNILMYQSSARLFHCSECFHTSRDFTKVYKHIISRHCMVDREGGGGGGGEEGEEEAPEGKGSGEEKDEKNECKNKLSIKVEVKEENGEKKDLEENQNIRSPKRRRSHEEEEDEDAPESKKSCEDDGKEEDGEKEGKEGETGGPEGVRSGEGDEEEEKQSGALAGGTPTDEEKKCVLMYDGVLFHCKICGWSHKQKSVSVSHIVRKHEIPKTYATHALTKSREVQLGVAEEEEGGGLSDELLMEEKKATEKWVGFVSHRFVCLVCNWRSKLKGFVLTHLERYHDLERPYSCKDCSQTFFLPSRLQQHVRTVHRPGRYACPFCCFRSEYLGGFRRHCSRCNAREGEVGQPAGGGGRGELEEEMEEEQEDRKETRGTRRRRSLGMPVEEEELEDEDDD